METFYISPEQFWEWFNRTNDREDIVNSVSSATCAKRPKTVDKPKTILDIEAGNRPCTRYCVVYGRHKPGRKTKCWEADGYLSLIGQMAHLCDLKGRMLEEPTILDDIDYKCVEELGELIIGSTEVQVIEIDK